MARKKGVARSLSLAAFLVHARRIINFPLECQIFALSPCLLSQQIIAACKIHLARPEMREIDGDRNVVVSRAFSGAAIDRTNIISQAAQQCKYREWVRLQTQFHAVPPNVIPSTAAA